MANVLLVHSNPQTRTTLATRLASEGHQVREQPGARAALDSLNTGIDLVLLEHALPDAPAHELLGAVREQEAAPPVIVLAAPADQVAPTLREGAYFCTRTPLDVDEVLVLTERALRESLGKRNGHSVRPPAIQYDMDDLLGDSAQIQAVKHAIRSVAASPDTNVLLTGESGTGKDLVARIIHTTTAPAGAFVSLTCSALPENLIESELFGTTAEASSDGVATAGLLEQAHGGSIYLDEIEALPAATQAKLLRFAEDKTYRRVGASSDDTSSARVIAATRRDVQQSFGEGKLREDLLHRLAVVTIQMPPLRERKEDIPILAKHYLGKFSSRLSKRVNRISGGALSLLQDHYWPGNVRELCNTLERATLLASGDMLESSHISFSPGSKPPPGRFRLPPQGIDFRELEREVVAQALELANGNQTRAASLLRMTRDQIRYRMAKFGIGDGHGPAELVLEPT